MTIEPILKWAGGKRRLLNEIELRLPTSVRDGAQFDYFEPFFGGGAVLFGIILNYNVRNVVINDINTRLTDFYRETKSNPEVLASEIESIVYAFNNSTHQAEMYYEQRGAFNTSNDKIESSALLYFLNKACFNGIYRENKKGDFNVPFGKKAKIQFDRTNFFEVAKFLNEKNVRIKNGSFEEIDGFGENSFFFLDPPYRPISKTASFTSYSHKSSDNDLLQKSLAKYCENINEKKGLFLQTNSFSHDGFFQELYKSFNQDQIEIIRGIAANSDSRTLINEIIIYNYMI